MQVYSKNRKVKIEMKEKRKEKKSSHVTIHDTNISGIIEHGYLLLYAHRSFSQYASDHHR